MNHDVAYAVVQLIVGAGLVLFCLLVLLAVVTHWEMSKR